MNPEIPIVRIEDVSYEFAERHGTVDPFVMVWTDINGEEHKEIARNRAHDSLAPTTCYWVDIDPASILISERRVALDPIHEDARRDPHDVFGFDWGCLGRRKAKLPIGRKKAT